ncbi:MAG: YtxH domain-containing protein [Chloroflexota bacterium]|nr:MAG: hypothetical protein DIU68_07870 [Chloroflexota bacterium]
MPLKRVNDRADAELDSGLLLFGLFVGLIAGGIVGLLNAPRSGRETRRYIQNGFNRTRGAIRQKVESAVPSSSLEDSIAEGKAVARRRLADLGVSES